MIDAIDDTTVSPDNIPGGPRHNLFATTVAMAWWLLCHYRVQVPVVGICTRTYSAKMSHITTGMAELLRHMSHVTNRMAEKEINDYKRRKISLQLTNSQINKLHFILWKSFCFRASCTPTYNCLWFACYT